MSLVMSVAILSVLGVKLQTFKSKSEFQITEIQISSQEKGSIDFN